MDHATLIALAERVEKAQGPDRALDARILMAISGGSQADADYAASDPERTCAPPAYTASLDAAAALVPEGWRLAYLGEWDSETLRARGPWQAILIRAGEGDSFGPELSPRCNHAATPALALTAAALRARAAMEG